MELTKEGIIVLVVILICFIYIYTISRKNAKITQGKLDEMKTLCQKLTTKIKKSIGSGYLNYSKGQHILNKYADEFSMVEDYKAQLYSEFELIYDIFGDLESCREFYNNHYINKCIEKYSQLYKDIDKKGLGLTEKQLEAVFSEEDASLVNAGAGTGKTKTIESKILHLVKNRDIPLEEILVVTYSKKSQLDMLDRIGKTLKKSGIKFNAERIKETISTFHAFGKNILEEENDIIHDNQSQRNKIIGRGGKNLGVLSDDKDKNIIIKKVLDTIIKSSVTQKIIAEFILYYNSPQVSVTDFDSLAEYYEYTRRTYKTLLKKGEFNITVKSYGEVLIANFLWLHGIEVEYEPIDHYYTNDQGKKKTYRPDFYLPKYDIYIEYFGLDKDGNTAPDVSNAEYNLRVKQKISAHAESGNILIDIRYADLQNGNSSFLKKLEHELLKHKVKLLPKSDQQVISMKEIEGEIKGLTKVLSSFLSLYKESHTSLPELRSKVVRGGFDPLNLPRNLLFLDLFEAYLNEYTSILAEQSLMDFGDMIYGSIDAIKSGRVKRKYKHILIDEFQDISQARAELIRSIIKSNNDCRLFCVGDDWQSIYQFTGSDVNIFANFEDYFGYTKQITLDKTFRFNQGISDISGDFIMMNPEQKEKELSSDDANMEGRVLIVQKEEGDNTQYINSIIADITSETDHNKSVSVMLLTRYNRHKYKEDNLLEILRPFLNNDEVDDDGEKIGGSYIIPSSNGINIHLTILTSHKSKGLEADYVILDYVEQGARFDFPSNFEDDPILQMILSDKNAGYRFAEERRVFYVSITRGKHLCYLCYSKGKESLFLKDLLKLNKERRESEESIVKYLTNDINTVSLYINEISQECPSCGGKLKTLEEDGVKTIKCRHHPRCPFMQTQYKNSIISCPLCQKAMVLRKNSSTGEKFWGCSDYNEGCLGVRKFFEG